MKYIYIIILLLCFKPNIEAQQRELFQNINKDISNITTEFSNFENVLNAIYDDEYVFAYFNSPHNNDISTFAFGDFTTEPKTVIFSQNFNEYEILPVSKEFITGIYELYINSNENIFQELHNNSLIFEKTDSIASSNSLYSFMFISNLKEQKAFKYIRIGYYDVFTQRNVLEVLLIAILNHGMIIKNKHH